jgi:LmbE family N-acetylglucosaminyl deacetylase
MSEKTLMAVFAHPDDEAFGTGGSLTRYAAKGCKVYLVTATRGESGTIAEPGLVTSANLPAVRERELSCACEVYGINPPIFLDYVDGQLPLVNQGQAVGKIVRLIRDLTPDVVLTFGPDGIYGHYDHIAVHRWTSIAVDLAAEPDCFPEQLAGTCKPHQVSKLYYRALSRDRVAAMAEGDKPAAVEMDGVPFYFYGWPEDQITTAIDVSEFATAKLNGIRCHASQIGQQSPYNETPDEVMREPWFSVEHFVLAKSRAGYPQETETDLLEGLS